MTGFRDVNSPDEFQRKLVKDGKHWWDLCDMEAMTMIKISNGPLANSNHRNAANTWICSDPWTVYGCHRRPSHATHKTENYISSEMARDIDGYSWDFAKNKKIFTFSGGSVGDLFKWLNGHWDYFHKYVYYLNTIARCVMTSVRELSCVQTLAVIGMSSTWPDEQQPPIDHARLPFFKVSKTIGPRERKIALEICLFDGFSLHFSRWFKWKDERWWTNDTIAEDFPVSIPTNGRIRNGASMSIASSIETTHKKESLRLERILIE